MWIAGFALFVLGLVFVIVAPINMRKNSRCSEQTQGTLSDIRARYNSNGRLPDMYVYSYSVDGVEYQIKSTILSKQANRVGDACTIWYDPKKPKKAQPFHYESAKVYKILLIVGIVMIPLGLVLIGAGAAQ
ncbi:MAG: DUF3592 domain-containing protein [Clostridia bacterium]|nr:DUF3592 domain-containing protein [Clostridia bacterium]